MGWLAALPAILSLLKSVKPQTPGFTAPQVGRGGGISTPPIGAQQQPGGFQGLMGSSLGQNWLQSLLNKPTAPITPGGGTGFSTTSSLGAGGILGGAPRL